MTGEAEGRLSTRRPGLENIEKDFNDAIDRLLANSPQNSKLKDMARSGQLPINSQTVAKEAGRSRTLISMKNCRLPRVRDRIINLNKKRPYRQRQSHEAELADLQLQIAELRDQLVLALEGQAKHFLAREIAEREAGKWRAAFRRQAEEGKDTIKLSAINATRTD